jgi:hypothetical protein
MRRHDGVEVYKPRQDSWEQEHRNRIHSATGYCTTIACSAGLLTLPERNEPVTSDRGEVFPEFQDAISVPSLQDERMCISSIYGCM